MQKKSEDFFCKFGVLFDLQSQGRNNREIRKTHEKMQGSLSCVLRISRLFLLIVSHPPDGDAGKRLVRTASSIRSLQLVGPSKNGLDFNKLLKNTQVPPW